MDSRSPLALGAVLALCGFLLVAVAMSAREQRRASEPRRAQLIELIGQRRALVAELDADVEALRLDLQRAQDEAAKRSTADLLRAAQAAALSRQAGTTALRGPGLVIRLADSDRQPPSPEEAGAYRIHDADVQLVVNALFAAGAEAVSVNGSRIVSTTPIRAAGDTIVVNFRPLNPPYQVHAIGADRRRFDASQIARRFKRWTGLFGLGFSVKEREDVRVPAYTGRVRIGTAVPVVG